MRSKRPSRMSSVEFRRFIEKRIGDFLAIPLDKQIAYGRIVRNGYLACYDLKSTSVLSMGTVAESPLLFIVPVNYDEYVTDRWKIIGHKLLESHLNQPQKFYREDPITKKIDIYFDGKFFPVTDEDISKLECAAAWSADNVEARLRKHFTGP